VGGLAGVLIGLGALVIPGIGPVIAAGPLATVLAGLAGAGAGAVAGGVLGALVDLGIPEETAGYYAEGVRRGGTLVSVRVEDQYTDKALDILNRHNPVDLDERSQQWRREGWTGYRGDIADTTPGAGRPMDTDYDTARTEQEHTRFDDTGVTHQDYDRSRQDVTDRDYRQYDETFRSDFQKRPFSRDFTYEQYEPAYRYGYDLRMDERYRDRNWEEIEPEARRRWEEQQEGTWDQYRDAIRYSWENTGDYWRYDDRFRTHFERADMAPIMMFTAQDIALDMSWVAMTATGGAPGMRLNQKPAENGNAAESGERGTASAIRSGMPGKKPSRRSANPAICKTVWEIQARGFRSSRLIQIITREEINDTRTRESNPSAAGTAAAAGIRA
jgi:hypothetical protein